MFKERGNSNKTLFVEYESKASAERMRGEDRAG